MFDDFTKTMVRDPWNWGAPPQDYECDDPEFQAFMRQFGGASFNKGVYRVIHPSEISYWNDLMGGVYPGLEGGISCFAYDWVGRIYATCMDDEFDGEPTIIVCDPIRNEVVDFAATLSEFHYATFGEAQFFKTYKSWLFYNRKPLSYDDCVGLPKFPVFRGGSYLYQFKRRNVKEYWESIHAVMSGWGSDRAYWMDYYGRTRLVRLKDTLKSVRGSLVDGLSAPIEAVTRAFRGDPFAAFQSVFIRDDFSPAPERRSIPVQDRELRRFLEAFSGSSFNGGQFRVVQASQIVAWEQRLAGAFPAHARQVVCFGYNWRNLVFALHKTERVGGRPAVCLFDVDYGEASLTAMTLRSLCNEHMVKSPESLLDSALYQEWIESGGEVPRHDQCVGHRIPTFLGGADELSNLGVCGIDVHWSLTGQIGGLTGSL